MLPSSQEGRKAARVALHGQEVLGRRKDAEWSEGRRATKRGQWNRYSVPSKTASSGHRVDERPRPHRMAKRDRNIGRWLVPTREGTE